MNKIDQLVHYFSDINAKLSDRRIGMEVETHFVTEDGEPISLAMSQSIFQGLTAGSWTLSQEKGTLITKVVNSSGDCVQYELGHQLIELSTIPLTKHGVVPHCQKILKEIYDIAEIVGAYPLFDPILNTTEDLLVIPDERDATWVEIDGRSALKRLATIAAVQFSIDVIPPEAIFCLNQMGDNIAKFLSEYPQDSVWRDYIKVSHAGYDPMRYGGPLHFESLEDYCQQLNHHLVVDNIRGKLVEQNPLQDIDLFLRSIWWYFRLRKHDQQLCVEVRPLSRRSDEGFDRQLNFVLDVMGI